MKKIIILGAMEMHVPLIEYAKLRGYYVITVDYTLDAPGHKIADSCSFISTTDLVAVEHLAKQENVDIIMTFNSDPAVYTSAYLSNKLGLKSNPPEAVKIMSDKGLFRQHLKDNSFQVPKFRVVSCKDDLEYADVHYPIIVKPVDSSGSKGVSIVYDCSKVNLAFDAAVQFSRSKSVIVEELVESDFHQLHGDCFVKDGILVSTFLGDHHFNNDLNGLVPYSTTFPTILPNDKLDRVRQEIQKFITSIGFCFGGVNVEARINKRNDEVYLIEVGARNGGNFTYKVIQECYGFDFLEHIFDCYENKVQTPKEYIPRNQSAYYIIHSEKDGFLKNIQVKNDFNNLCYKFVSYCDVGDKVSVFSSSDKAIGVMLISSNEENIYEKIKNHNVNVQVSVDE